MARKKDEDQTPVKRGYAPSGWCITNDHNDCIEKFIYSDCSCDCHKGDNDELE